MSIASHRPDPLLAARLSDIERDIRGMRIRAASTVMDVDSGEISICELELRDEFGRNPLIITPDDDGALKIYPKKLSSAVEAPAMTVDSWLLGGRT